MFPSSIIDSFRADTQNGCICLEALIPDVSVPILGKGFDGKSAHDFRLKPSTPGQIRRSTLQLRPGEVFYVQDLCLTLLPEESHEYFVRSAADGEYLFAHCQFMRWRLPKLYARLGSPN